MRTKRQRIIEAVRSNPERELLHLKKFRIEDLNKKLSKLKRSLASMHQTNFEIKLLDIRMICQKSIIVMSKLRNLERWKYLSRTDENLRELNRRCITVNNNYPFKSMAHNYYFTKILYYLEKDTNKLVYKEFNLDKEMIRRLINMGNKTFWVFVRDMKDSGAFAEIQCRHFKFLIINPRLAYNGTSPNIEYLFKFTYDNQYGLHKFRKRGILKDEI